MGLEDITDSATDRHPLLWTGAGQFLIEDSDAAFLDSSQRPSQGKHRRFTRAGRPGQNNDLAAEKFGGHVMQDALAQGPGTERVANRFKDDNPLVIRGGEHFQKISAGSAERSLRIASAPETAHIKTVSPRTRATRPKVA